MFGLYYEDCSELYAAAVWISAATSIGIAVVFGGMGIVYLKRVHAADLAKAQQ